jgi:beta-glucosidase
MMKKYNRLLPTILLAVITMTNVHAQKNAVVEAKIDQLLKKMTLEDKVGQMAQVSIEALGTVSPDGKSFNLDPAKLTDAINKYKIGSSLNTPPGVLLSAAEWNVIQEQFYTATQKNNLKIPLLYGLDDVLGVNYASGTTLFPQVIG